MINEIIEAIGVSLHEEFGDGYEIYMEEIRQGLKEPCFFIQCLNPTHTRFLGKRYRRESQFCIQYFPQSEEAQRECNEVAERMWWLLEHVTIIGDNKPIRGTQMKYEVIDGVLSFFVNYDVFLIKTRQQVVMGSMESKTSVKAGD